MRPEGMWILLLVVGTSGYSPAIGDDSEEKIEAKIQELKGRVQRNADAPGRPIVSVSLHQCRKVADAH